MAYLRNPRMPYCWESDGAAPWCKYKADDGTIHDSAQEADGHDLERGYGPWDEALDAQQTRMAIAQLNAQRKTVPMPRKAVWVAVGCLGFAAGLFLYLMAHALTDWAIQITDFLRSL